MDGHREHLPLLRLIGERPVVDEGLGGPVRSGVQQRLLAALALAGPVGLTPEQAVEACWPSGAPETAKASLHNHVHRLRGRLGEGAIAWSGSVYRLDPTVPTDLRRIVELREAARARRAVDDHAGVLDVTREALDLSLGEVLSGMPDIQGREQADVRLTAAHEELRRLHLDALVATGQTEEAVGELRASLQRDSANEHLWVTLMRALQASGRRQEALETYHTARLILREHHGLDPSEPLRSAQRRLLEAQGEGTPAASDVVERPGARDSLIRRLRDRRLVLLRGQAGIGKTSLATMVARAWPGRAITITCDDNPWTALGPIHHLLEQLRPELVGAEGPQAGVTGGLPADTRPRQPGPLQQHLASTLVDALDQVEDVLVVVDDVDRGGPTSLGILRKVLVGCDAHALLIGRAPSAGLQWDDLDVAELTGFGVEEVARLVEQRCGRTVLEEHARWLHDLTGGHPMLLDLVLQDLCQRDPGWADRSERPALPEIPAQLRTVLGERLQTLPTSCRRALDVAAAIGRSFDVRVLQQLVDSALLEPASAAGIISDLGGAMSAFSHDLWWRVAYDQVPPGRRQELHYTLGLGARHVRERADHLLNAAALDPDAAIAAARTAGLEALEEGAYAEAKGVFARAAEVAREHGREPDLAILKLEAADAARLAGESGHARPLLEAASALVDGDRIDLRRRAVLAMSALGELVDAGEDHDTAAGLAARAMELEEDPTWWARMAATSSLIHSISGEPEVCRTRFVDAVGAYEPSPEVDVDVLPYAYMALSHVDDLERREQLTERLERAAELRHDPVAAFEAGHLRFSCALMRGDGVVARRTHEAMRVLLDRVTDAGRRWSHAYQEAALLVLDGDLQGAEGANATAWTIGSTVAPARAMAAFSGQLFEIRRLQGRLAELADGLDQLVEQQPEIAAWRAAGALAHAGVDAAKAAALFDSVVDDGLSGLPRDFAWLAGVMSLGRAAVALRDPDRAAAIAPWLEPYEGLVCWQGTCTYGPVAEVLADLAAVQGLDDARLRRTAAGLAASLRGPAP